MFRRLTREVAPELGQRFAALAKVGALFAVCLERPGSLLHDLAELRPAVYLLQGHPMRVGSYGSEPLMVGVDYGAMLKASELVEKGSRAGKSLAKMLAAYRIDPRVIACSGSARYHYHEPARLARAKRNSVRAEFRRQREQRNRAELVESPEDRTERCG